MRVEALTTETRSPRNEASLYSNFPASVIHEDRYRLEVEPLVSSWPILDEEYTDDPITLLFQHYQALYRAGHQHIGNRDFLLVAIFRSHAPPQEMAKIVLNTRSGKMEMMIQTPPGESQNIRVTSDLVEGIKIEVGKQTFFLRLADGDELLGYETTHIKIPVLIGNAIKFPLSLASPLIFQASRFPGMYEIEGYYAMPLGVARKKAADHKSIPPGEIAVLAGGKHIEQMQVGGDDLNTPPWDEWRQDIIRRIQLHSELHIIEE